ncbi:Acyltransferase family protein [Lachnospiraceae bacterium G41]|nr:Acyltransferase family protein [Lachnospiraceae bacterium G41]
MKESRKVLPDILRVVLTAFVLFHHYQQLTGTFFYRGINFYGGKFYFGYVVEIFFLMSGFFMVPYVKRIQDKMSFPTFFGKRLIRFLPSMIAATIFYDIALFFYVRLCNGTLRYPTDINIFGSIVTALGLGSWSITKDFEINPICWYVSVLLLCYILMYIFVFLSKITKIPAGILLAIPMIAGVVITHITEFSIIPFLSTRIARGYIHFFGGLLLGIIFVGLFGKGRKANSNGISEDKIKTKLNNNPDNQNNKLSKEKAGFVLILKRMINRIGEATLDIYLIQLPVLLLFFIVSFYTGLNLVSGKTMLLYAVVTFFIGGLYYFLIGKRIHLLLSKLFVKKKV